MILFAHIVTSIVGIIGTYLAFVASLERINKKTRSVKMLHTGLRLTAIGLIGVVISGVLLFATKPELFLHSGKFLSNITIVVALVFIESAYFLMKKTKQKAYLRVLSVYSWTWIFVMALLNPPYPYHYFIIVYSALLVLVTITFSKKAQHFFLD
jgi:hypothetical protein